ncbi:MAG: thrombospondin type 3 repeat-containing protein [Candidatus Thermoplasmatota archaeon]|nr:thrombospondin type 3 repeat-containing protein [Candidatus Thermoplasmatota archaeon]MEC8815818.1 thrombospondin type 3 repeat-containing protein [Candidatus Thermoplasmatota archaeon]
MRRTPAGLALSLTVLLLLSIIGSTLVNVAPVTVLDDDLETSMNTGGRSTSAEVFLAGGGSSTHDEFSGAIASVDNGWVIAGDVNSSAASLVFGTQTYTPTSPYSNGNDFFLASVDNSGTWNYVVGADHSQGGVSFMADVTSHAGNGIVAGYMYGPVDFGMTSLSTAVQFDGFVAQADAMGNWMWAKGFQTLPNSSTDSSIPQAVTVDQLGDVIVAGYFSGETDFGGTTFNVSNAEIFIAKLDGANGALKWAVTGGGIGNQQVTDIVVDNAGNIHVAVLTQNNVLFGTNSYNVVGTQDSVIVKLSSAGAFQSVTGYGIANQAVSLTALAVDANGDLYAGGSFEGTMAKNGWSITANKGGSDLFFIKEGTTPSNQWAATGGSNSADSLQAMDVSSAGELVFTAFFLDGTFSAGTKSTTGTSSNWIATLDADVMLGGLTNTGGWSWLDVTGSAALEVGWDIAFNGSDVAAAVGSYIGPAGSDTITKGTDSVTTAGGWDLFVWALDPSMKADTDNDGVPDVSDNCPNDSNPLQGNTDGDAQGDACDSDDDNDGITDNSPDDCPRGGAANWGSTQNFDDPANSTDWDRDGCKDDVEDADMDNDGVENDVDLCPRSSYQPPRPTWVSDSITDVDGDGCRDADEDTDDDGDGFEDVSDDCPTVVGNSTLGEEGCQDNDGDGWSNNFDDCPNEFGNSTLGGKNACPDMDGDGWADADDAFTEDPTQWSDADGDGYGDNTEGTTPDDCPTVAGTSTLDRLGCLDTDSDGYSDPDGMWDAESGADAFIDDPTQWSDFDGDGYGDNYANDTWTDRNPSWPGEYRTDVVLQDACPTQEGTSWQNGLIGCPDQDGDGWYNLQDAFPNDPTQWSDTDGDGYGDNASGTDADQCPDVAGTSTADRLGCEDSDGDGYSDPDPNTNWLPANGADAFPSEPTQWADQDSDFYGDNPAGDRADACPTVRGTSTVDRLGCEDSDGDGISDETDTWTLAQGADACPLAYGTSTADRIGCADTDGDNYSDPTPDYGIEQGADAYPQDPTRWILEPKEDETFFASTNALIGTGVGLLLALVVIGLIMRRRGGKDTSEWTVPTGAGAGNPGFAAPVAMPDFGAQPVSQPAAQPAYAAPVAMPDFNAQPVVAQPDPARDYYNSLLAQGYPHDDAVRYTQQYFQQFQG